MPIVAVDPLRPPRPPKRVPPTLWDFPVLLLWSAFFAIGLVPEPVFYLLRDFANVSRFSAFVNSSFIITLGFAGYFGFFVLNRCREGGLSDSDAYPRAVQAFVLGLLAFLEIPTYGGMTGTPSLIQLLGRLNEIPDTYLRNVVILTGMCKLTAWLYLFSTVVRYYVLGQRDIFLTAAGFFRPTQEAQVNGRPAPGKGAESAKGAESGNGAARPTERGGVEDEEFVDSPRRN
ncbi:MAG: hypothetical protein WD873_01925 [Candidatus Hydrogenedentales bacterium]